MSNYSSVILAFVAPDWEELGLEAPMPYPNPPDDALRSATEGAFANLASERGNWHVRDAQWCHGQPAGETMCCETVVRFCVNHFDPDPFWDAVYAAAPWLRNLTYEPQAWWKDEEADSYSPIPRAPTT